MNNFDFNFTDCMKKDNVVENHITCSSTAHAIIINTINNAIGPTLGDAGGFPILANASNSFFDIFRHFAPGSSNIMMQMASKTKAITGLVEMDQPIEVKHLQHLLANGKNKKSNHFFEIESVANIYPKCKLATSVVHCRDFALYPNYFWRILK